MSLADGSPPLTVVVVIRQRSVKIEGVVAGQAVQREVGHARRVDRELAVERHRARSWPPR